MTHDEYVLWAKAQDDVGKVDPMGYPWSSWLLAVYNPDGSAVRDSHGRQIFETQAEYLNRRQQVPFGHTLELFA